MCILQVGLRGIGLAVTQVVAEQEAFQHKVGAGLTRQQFEQWQ